MIFPTSGLCNGETTGQKGISRTGNGLAWFGEPDSFSASPGSKEIKYYD